MSVICDVEAVDYRAFGEELDELKRRTQAKIGPDDLRYVRRLNWFSRTMEVIGRVLIHVSPEPITFFLGVGALWVHKQLQATEIGHTALHGAYDHVEGAERFASRRFSWDTPIDEESWREGHNVRHHGNTNVAGRDPDIHFGPIRLTEHTPYAWHHKWQVPFAIGVLFPNFGFMMNLHFTGLHDVISGNGLANGLDVLPDLSPESKRLAWKRTLRKYVPYYLKNYVLFPLLAGPFWWKVLLGNWLAETMRDVYSAATIFCGHVGEDVHSYPLGTRAKGRGQWYAMQIRASNDFEVPRLVSIFCGGLDRQIEHHLFPTFPPERLREIAPEVKALCEKYGVEYKTASWGSTLRKAFRHIADLSRQGGVRAVVREMA
ncbi:MAG: acyl-CoA desaturase [Deltaproteobacteria bacterium]|nr:acyl-CoA desaturase [Deltaproteobacteria bacterium]